MNVRADRPDPAARELPRLDAVFDYHEKLMELGAAAQALAGATLHYQALNSATWWSSWFDFATRHTQWRSGDVFGFVDQGLDFANEAMLELHHSDGFLDAQRELVERLARFRRRHREVAEAWQIWNHAPTQQDVDDLAKTLYDLRREVRRLRREKGQQEQAA